MKKVFITLSLLFTVLGISSAQRFYSIGYGDFYEADRDTYTTYPSKLGDLDDTDAFTNKVTGETVFDGSMNNQPGIMPTTDSVMIEINIGEVIALNDTDIDTIVYTIMGARTGNGSTTVTAHSRTFGNAQSSAVDGLKYFSFKGVENQKDTIILTLDDEDEILWLNVWKLGEDWTGNQLTSTVITNNEQDLFALGGSLSVSNPSQDGILAIQMEQDVSQLSLELLSLDGTVVLEEQLEEAGSHNLDVSFLNTGLYILRELTTGSTKKIIIQ